MRYFRMTEELDAHIAARLQKEELTATELCVLARTLKASSDVVFKYMKLHEKSANAQPLIEVGLQALPVQRNGKSLDEPF